MNKLNQRIAEVEKGCGYLDNYSKSSRCIPNNLCSDCKHDLALLKLGKQAVEEEQDKLMAEWRADVKETENRLKEYYGKCGNCGKDFYRGKCPDCIIKIIDNERKELLTKIENYSLLTRWVWNDGEVYVPLSWIKKQINTPTEKK